MTIHLTSRSFVFVCADHFVVDCDRTADAVLRMETQPVRLLGKYPI